MADILWKSIIGLIALIIGTTSVIIYKGKQDNPIEEIAEMVIQSQTGVDIDLTPTSPENKGGDKQ